MKATDPTCADLVQAGAGTAGLNKMAADPGALPRAGGLVRAGGRVSPEVKAGDISVPGGQALAVLSWNILSIRKMTWQIQLDYSFM